MAFCSADGCSRTEPCGPYCRDNGNFDTQETPPITTITDAHRAEARRRLEAAGLHSACGHVGYYKNTIKLLAQALAEDAWRQPVDPDLTLAENAKALQQCGRISSHPNIAVGQLAADLRTLAGIVETLAIKRSKA